MAASYSRRSAWGAEGYLRRIAQEPMSRHSKMANVVQNVVNARKKYCD
jgi:hypothetical protein